MEFELHPDKDMGLYIAPAQNGLTDEPVAWAFPLTNDELSSNYIAWRELQESI